MRRLSFLFVAITLLFTLSLPNQMLAKEEKAEDKAEEKTENEEENKKEKKPNNDIPSHVLNISKENTYPNTTRDQTVLEPNELAEELIESADEEITNPELIKMLNESTLKPSKLAFGYRGEIYLGYWPIHYKSKESNVNWEYQQINTNISNNLGGTEKATLNYVQESEKRIKGGLTSKTEKASDVMKMMLLSAQDKTDLPLAFETVFGSGTKKTQTYGVPPKKVGYLYSYAPALNEKGVVTFGEVYLVLKGSKKSLEVKNVTKQGIGAWIPIQDHVSFSFQLKNTP
ncbi:YfkD famly protein [Salirhabdus sp. Marseille-P4669]|uniref:YfkD famly protein n=1 Tax=Salirhabdus sp. Marseille-P4669 TaxID=2042310 RepID=UPI001F158EDC|nr:YfkD famly protein [Salirhabdus sp. Marseille-P4669]